MPGYQRNLGTSINTQIWKCPRERAKKGKKKNRQAQKKISSEVSSFAFRLPRTFSLVSLLIINQGLPLLFILLGEKVFRSLLPLFPPNCFVRLTWQFSKVILLCSITDGKSQRVAFFLRREWMTDFAANLNCEDRSFTSLSRKMTIWPLFSAQGVTPFPCPLIFSYPPPRNILIFNGWWKCMDLHE